MKRTLIITLEFPPQIGGIATYVQDMARALPPGSVYLLAPKHPGADAWDKAQPYEIIRKKMLFPKFFWPRWLRLLIVVYRLCREKKIELIILHHVLPVGYVANIIQRLLHIPFLVFSHGTDILLATKTSWKKARLRGVVAASQQIIFNSESLRHRFLQVLPAFEEKTIVVYPCPSPLFFGPPDKNEVEGLRHKYALEGKKVILSIARFAEGKGFPHLTRALTEVVKKNPNVVWLIIGSGPKQKEVLADIQAHSLQNNVRFIGEIPQPQLKSYYHLADIFILLTHPDEGREEGLGLVFLEAAACGRAIIAGKSGGVEEAVLHTQTGLVFDVHREALHIQTAILELLGNPDFARRLGEAAEERVRTNFNWQHQLAKLDKWLK